MSDIYRTVNDINVSQFEDDIAAISFDVYIANIQPANLGQDAAAFGREDSESAIGLRELVGALRSIPEHERNAVTKEFLRGYEAAVSGVNQK